MLMEFRQGTTYKGYTLWQRKGLWVETTDPDKWGAYTAFPSVPWFEGQTFEEVVKLIDAAYEELPDPVY